MSPDTVYVVLLNWRGWRDTIACLETVLASADVSLRAIVCDNGSGDGSLERIQEWACGERRGASEREDRLNRLLGKVRFPLNVLPLDREAANGGADCTGADLILVDNAANLGFARGNNVGLRLAMAQQDMTHVWVLNNDTLVEPDCLAAMLRELLQNPRPAVCGSVINFTDCPDRVQAIGGNRFNFLTGVAGGSAGRYLPETALDKQQPQLDYLSGCSMLLPRAFLDEVGLMNEALFLYYEEIDWFTRAAKRFDLRVAMDARLYHREGSAIGSPGWGRNASTSADQHLYRSRLIYMREHFPRRMAACYAGITWELGKSILRGRLRHALAIAQTALGLVDPTPTEAAA